MYLYEKNRMQANTDDLVAYLTPHLNVKWHKRSYLPEIRNDYNTYYDKLARETFLSGIIYGDILHSTSQQNTTGWTWKYLENRTFNEMKDEFGYALNGTLSGLLDYLHDNPEHVLTLLKPISNKLSKDRSTDNRKLDEREYFQKINNIKYQGSDINILELLAKIYLERNDQYHSNTCDLLLKDFAEDLSDMLISIYTKNQLNVAAGEYDRIISDLISTSESFNTIDKYTEWIILLDSFKPGLEHV
jgi:hypothetical protein